MLIVPGSKFINEQIAPALLDWSKVLKKDADGSLEALELSDLDEAEIGGGGASRTGETTTGSVALERTPAQCAVPRLRRSRQ